MSQPFFPEISSVSFEGPQSESEFAFRYYDKNRVVLGKTMQEHLRFAVCYWHSFVWNGSDVFGQGTFPRAWHQSVDPIESATQKAAAAFEFFEKLGVPYFCFHDRDVVDEGDSLIETEKRLDQVAELLAGHMKKTGVKLLWGTANLFSHPRYAAGAATNPDPEVFTMAAAQVKKALDMTAQLGGENYVLWGGREGYETLLNTKLGQEMDQLGRFLSLVAEYKHKIGFKGTLLIEPKPMEPTKHQYDFDTANVHAFLRKYGLEKEYKVNIEVNHATLAGHSFHHEVEYAIANDLFGSIDANRGDPQLGWDTDQFPNSVEEMSLALYSILQAGGFTTGGFNFDAKLRRQSMDSYDLFHGHIGGMDTLAIALLRAAQLIGDGFLQRQRDHRYAEWANPLGQSILDGKQDLAGLAKTAHDQKLWPSPSSGRQESLENYLTRQLQKALK